MEKFLELLSYYQYEHNQSFDKATKSALQQMRLENPNVYTEIASQVSVEIAHHVTDN